MHGPSTVAEYPRGDYPGMGCHHGLDPSGIEVLHAW